MKPLVVESPAKINLCLYVLGKREDGYHDILTLFQRISLCDRIAFRKMKKGFALRVICGDVPQDSNNLIYKAYSLLKHKTGLKNGIEISLEKRIPVAAGLGGGSSNAASTLMALNRIYKLGLRKDELLSMGKQLGADVPFFILDTSQALARGRGDELYPIPFSTKLSLLLTILPGGVSTKEVYESLAAPQKEACLTKLNSDATMLSDFFASRDVSSAAVLLRNELLSSAVRLKPAIGRVLRFLITFWPASMMSGSGPTLFSLTRSVKEAQRGCLRVSEALGLQSWYGNTF